MKPAPPALVQAKWFLLVSPALAFLATFWIGNSSYADTGTGWMLSAWWIGGLIAVLLVIVAALAFTQAWKPDGGVVQFILRFFIFLLGIAAINLGIAFAGCAMTGLMP